MTQRIVGLLGALLLMVACGGSNKSQAPAPAPPAPAPAPAPPVEGEGGPDAKLTETQCAEAVDHVIKLVDADAEAKAKGFSDQMRASHDQMVANCQETAHKKDYDCLMAAKVFADLGACTEPGQ